jgi:hypothetical protein
MKSLWPGFFDKSTALTIVGDTAKKYTKRRFSSLNHQNFEFFGLVHKSPTHTGLICEKKNPILEYLKLGPL